MTRSAVLIAALAAPLFGQYAGGTIFQSLDALQPSGVSAIGLPGNGSLTTGEVLTFSAGWTNGAKSLFSSEALGAVLGDRNGDGKPFDWVNVDAMHVTWTNPAFQPKPTDFRFSFEYDLVNGSGTTVISNGDIFKLTGNGTYQVTIPRSAFISSLGYVTPGTGYKLNVDGYAEMSDGTVLVSFKNDYPTTAVGQANNVIHPLFGTTVPNLTIYGEDIFAIRQPYGAHPAVLVYRNADFQPLANALFSNYGFVFEIRDFDLQPGVAAVNNPYDPLNIWNSGNRPHIVFTFYGDENVVCTQPVPATGNTNVWAYVQSATGVGKYSTNLAGAGAAAVYMDALAIHSNVMPNGSAITIDSSPHSSIFIPGLGTATASVPQNTAGSAVTFTARNLQGGANQIAAFLLGFSAHPGNGYYLGTGGYNWLFINLNDPLLPLCLQPPLSTILLTGNSDANGTASTAPFTIPANTAGFLFYMQALQIGGSFGLSAPQAIRIV